MNFLQMAASDIIVSLHLVIPFISMVLSLSLLVDCLLNYFKESNLNLANVNYEIICLSPMANVIKLFWT